jgi:glycosyltransferase involved in cell wall biosynthesis
MTSFEPGGTERQMIELARRLDRSRWSVHLACFHATGSWFDRIAGSVASVTEFPVVSFQHPSVAAHLRAFARWCRERGIAVVHATELYSNIFGLAGAALARVPVRIGSRRGMNGDKPRGLVALQRAAYTCAHIVVANSRAAAARLRAERVPVRKIAIIPNGLDLGAFQPRTSVRPPRRVAVVANLRAGKGHDVLIDAAAQVLRSVPDASFELIGDGAERERLAARCDARRVRHAFTFTGHSENVAARLAGADIFALPSLSEAFPNAVLEGMASGLPVVASDVGGIPELVTSGDTGLLVPPADPAALADALLRLMTDAPLSSRLGRAARATVEARYSFERMVAAFDRCYAAGLSGRGADAVEPAAALAS